MIELEVNKKVNLSKLPPSSPAYKKKLAERDRFKTCQCDMLGPFTPDKAFEGAEGAVTLLKKMPDGSVAIFVGVSSGNGYKCVYSMPPVMTAGVAELAKASAKPVSAE